MIFYFYLVCFTFSISHSKLPFHLVCFPISPSLLFFCFDVHLKHSRKGFVCVYIYMYIHIYVCMYVCVYIYTPCIMLVCFGRYIYIIKLTFFHWQS